MSNVRSVAATQVLSGFTPSKQFLNRLVVSSVMTALDAAAIVFVGPLAYQYSSISSVPLVAFAILSMGMLASVGRIWFLTIRSWNGR
jgi:hypothetical protein